MRRYPDRRYYQRVAVSSGYPIAPLERVFRLADLLVEITTRVPGELLLRGGTALNLLHLQTPRLSVDLDLDYIGSASTEVARRRRPTLLASLEALASDMGYAVTRAQESYAMSHVIVRYENTAGSPDALKLDINFLDRVPVTEPLPLPLRHPFGDDLTALDVMTFTLPELAAGKIIALARRGLARDLYDVAQLANLLRLDSSLVRTLVTVRGAAYPSPGPEDYSVDAGSQVRRVDWRAQVVALARRDQAADLAAAQAAAAKLLGDVFALERRHLDFLHALEAGTLDARLLVEPELVERVEANPGLLWRLQRGASALEER